MSIATHPRYRTTVIVANVTRLLRRAEELALNQHLSPEQTVVCLNRTEVEGEEDGIWDYFGRSILWQTVEKLTGVSVSEVDRFFKTAEIGTFRKIKDIQSGLALYGSPDRELAFACYDYDNPHHKRLRT